MLSKEEIEKEKEHLKIIERNYTYNNHYSTTDLQAIETLLQYIDQLEQKNESLKKGQASLMTSRKKWKDRAYKLRKKSNKLNKMIDEMANIIKDYDIDYSDICKYWIVRNCEKEPTSCKECIKQYFEKKAEES